MAAFQENQQGVQGFLEPRLGPCTSAKVSLPLHFTEWSKPRGQSKFKECGTKCFLSMEGDAQSECKGLEWKEWRMETIFPNVLSHLDTAFGCSRISPGESNPCHDVIIYCHHISNSYPVMSYFVFYKIWFVFCQIEDCVFVIPFKGLKIPQQRMAQFDERHVNEGQWQRLLLVHSNQSFPSFFFFFSGYAGSSLKCMGSVAVHRFV